MVKRPQNRIKMMMAVAFIALTLGTAVLASNAQAADTLPGGGGDDPPSSPVTTESTTSSPITGEQTTGPSCGGGSDGGSCAIDATTTPEGNLPDDDVGNPINLMSGNKHQSETDFQVPGAMLTLRRMYNSGDSDSNRGLGQGWSHTFAVTLMDMGDGTRQIIGGDGSRINFYPDGNDENGHPLYRAHQSNHGYLSFENERHYWHLSDGRTLKFTGQYLVNVNWPDQRELKLFYRQRRLHSVTDETGRVLRFNYNDGRAETLPSFEQSRYSQAAGYLKSVTLPDGSEIGYDYDSNRNLTRVRYPDETTREYHYENKTWPNHLTGLTDRTGVRFASWSYDGQGRGISSEHAEGVEKVTFAYPDEQSVASGKPVQTVVTNSLGYESTYTWLQKTPETHPQLLSSEGAGCATCPETGYEYAYDAQGRLTDAVKNTQGQTLTQGSLRYEYDDQGRLTRIDQDVVAETGEQLTQMVERREYQGLSLTPVRIVQPSVSAADERATLISYNEAGLPVSVTEQGYAPVVSADNDVLPTDQMSATSYQAIERTTQLGWSGNRLVTIDGPRTDVDDITRLEWDDGNRLVRVAPALSPALSIQRFDAMGRAVLLQLGEQTAVELEYDLSGQLVGTRQGGKQLQFDYDKEGRLSRIIDLFDRTLYMEHDTAGRISSFTDDIGRRTVFEHDSESQLLKRTSLGIDGASIRMLEFLFDEKGEITSLQEQRDGGANGQELDRTVTQQRDADGSVMSDAESGARISTALDLVNRVAILTDASGRQRTLGFDVANRTTRVTDQRGNTTRYWFDDFGREVARAGNDTGVERFGHDEVGNRIEQHNADGTRIRYQYDAANRRIERQDQDSVSRFVWDPLSGKLLESDNGQVLERFAYDSEARLISHTRQIDNHSFQTRYVYDGLGRLLEKVLPDGQTLRYHYHEQGTNRGSLRAITRSSLFGLNDQTVVAEIDLERRDGQGGYLSSNGVRTTYKYAPDGQIEHIEVGGQLALSYGFDAQGRIVSLEENGQQQSYRYEGQRLTQADTLLGYYTYSYDAVDNRVSRQVQDSFGASANESYHYPPEGKGNRLLQTSDEANALSTGYEYDANGAPLQVGDLSYTYDTEQRPVTVSRFGKPVAAYTYNSFGERVKKVVYDAEGTPSVSYFLYDGSTLVAEVDGQGSITDQYVYLEGHRPVARLQGSQIQSIHTDHLGAPRLLSDAQGKLLWQAQYSPFGEATLVKQETTLNLRLPGQYLDTETGTHYNYQRYYDPSTGRYQTSDPLGLAAGLNTYGYVGGNPLSMIDPLGLNAAVAPTVWISLGGATGYLAALAQAAGVGAAAVVASPVVVGTVIGAGVVASAVVLALILRDHFAGNEANFSAELGIEKPSAHQFQTLRNHLADYGIVENPMSHTGPDDWTTLFILQDQLLQAQRDYVDAHPPTTIGGNSCEYDPLYEGALTAIIMATLAQDAADDAEEGSAAAAPASDAEMGPNDGPQPAPSDAEMGPNDGPQQPISHEANWPPGVGQIAHILQDREGHLPDTPENREELMSVVDADNYEGRSERGDLDIYLRDEEDGTQTWMSVREGVIQNAGVNEAGNHYHFDPVRGLVSDNE